jgi:hypothetical protein
VRLNHVIKALVVAAAAALVLSVGAALAVTTTQKEVWVSPTASTSAKDKSCATASFTSVQAAIDAVQANGTVYLCGTTPFQESVAIQDKAVTLKGDSGATLQAPADASAPTNFFSSQGLETPNAVVTVIGSSNVRIQGLTVEGPFTNADCNSSAYGILAVGGQLALTNDHVLNVRDSDQAGHGGCQYGVGIQVGRENWPATGGGSNVVDFNATAKVQSATVSGYQKNGIATDGVGSKVTVTGSTVDGGGQTSTIARNGIEIVRGATGTVNKSTVSNNEYTGTNGSAAAGVLVYGGCGDPLATNVTVGGNTITDNDMGVALDNYTADCSASATTVTDNIVKNNTITKDDGETNQGPFTDWQNTAYTGYQVGIGDSGDGDHISGNTITGTLVGGNDTAYGPQHQAGSPFLDCIDLITYPPTGAKLSGNTCDGSNNYPVMPGGTKFKSGDNGDPSSAGNAALSGGAALLTSVENGYGLVSATFRSGTTFSQLASLETDYNLTKGTCAGGSPRYQVDLSDGNPADAVSLYLYFGTPPFGGCPAGPNHEGEVIGGSSAQWFVFGGGFNSNVPMTYSQVKAAFGSYDLNDVQIAVDGGWAQTGGDTQQVSITNWELNGKYFFAG